MRTTMSWKLSILGALLAAAVACGGGGGDMAEEPESAAMDHEGMEAETDSGAQEMEMLGGGHASLVHEGTGGSPHVSVHWGIGEGNITIEYGRPYLNDRVVGESVPPMADAVWRLGADEATTLRTDRDLMIGEAHIPAGDYTLWTAHMNDEFHLIVNSETGQWGTAYNGEHDVAHIAMEVGELNPPVEQLVIAVEEDALSFDWGTLTASVPLMVH